MNSLEVQYCAEVRKTRHTFLKAIDPYRADLFRFCRSLTRTPWDAEDLVQETVAKAYSKLGEVWIDGIANPKSYLFRMASNIWIDQCRRANLAQYEIAPPQIPQLGIDQLDVRDALTALLTYLPPKERVAVLLKDIFDYQLEEIASIMGTTVGGVKSALSRGRQKMEILKNSKPSGLKVVPNYLNQNLLNDLVKSFNERDMDKMISLFLENASGEVYGTVQEWNREQIRRGSMGHTIYDGNGKPLPLGYPEGRIIEIFGEKLLAIFDKDDVLDDVLRFREEEGFFAGFTSYYFCPEVLTEVAGMLKVKFNTHNYYFFKES